MGTDSSKQKKYGLCSRRWLRHWLLWHSPSGVQPYPIEFWLTLPNAGAVDPYRYGNVYSFVLNKISPKDFSVEEVENLRAAYAGDDVMFEVLFQGWIREHPEYLRWYAKVLMEPRKDPLTKRYSQASSGLLQCPYLSV